MDYDYYSPDLHSKDLHTKYQLHSKEYKIVLIGKEVCRLESQLADFLSNNTSAIFKVFANHEDALNQFAYSESITNGSVLVLCDANLPCSTLDSIASGLNIIQKQIPLVIYSEKFYEKYKQKALEVDYVDDFLYQNLGLENILSRLFFLTNLKTNTSQLKISQFSSSFSRKGHFAKRVLDVVLASVLLVLLSPILILISVIIKIESPGSALFISKRVGSGYKVFDFYKFRSMSVGADNMRNDLSSMNEYLSKTESDPSSPLFFKIKDDPRVTRVGKFLRKTSLDELPQLVNVLKGDMSLVGNRPLPLDEAATLTEDRSAARFLAPSGITGLWQVSKRKDEVSIPERIKMDLKYMKNSSFRNDLKILWKTVPAMLQK